MRRLVALLVLGAACGSGAAPAPAEPTTLDFDAYRDEAFRSLVKATQRDVERFHIDALSWRYDQDTGKLTFHDHGVVRAEAEGQLLCSFLESDNSFVWGWANSSFRDDLKVAANETRKFGENNHWTHLTTPRLNVDEQQAWDFAAVAMHVNGLAGVYRGPYGNGLYVFIGYRPLVEVAEQ